MYDIVIIGAGIIGAFVARELAKYDLKTIIVEKDNDISNGATKANSGIVHSGYDAKPNSLKARFNVEGNAMMEEICNELEVPFKRIGSLVVAYSSEDIKKLEDIYNRGIINKVPGLRIIDREELFKMEPNISSNAIKALYAPTAAIIGPWELAIALIENAVDNRVELCLNSEVLNIKKINTGFKIITSNRELHTKYIINCAGIYGDKIYNMVAKPYFEITPRKGQYFLLDKTVGNLVNKIIFQCPDKISKGIVLLPTVHGNILVGPDAVNIQDKENKDTTEYGLNYIREKGLKTSNKIPFDKVITSFSGLRASSNTGDFIIEEAGDIKNFINIVGIDSPGLTASPAIGKYVVELLKEIDGEFKENKDFKPKRKEIIKFMNLSKEDKDKTIKNNHKYGRIICRCENITEGEIIDSIQRNAGGKTVDGIKRRVRPGSGRCQGGFCQPKVMEILARELEIDMIDIVKDGLNSNIIIERTK